MALRCSMHAACLASLSRRSLSDIAALYLRGQENTYIPQVIIGTRDQIVSRRSRYSRARSVGFVSKRTRGRRAEKWSKTDFSGYSRARLVSDIPYRVRLVDTDCAINDSGGGGQMVGQPTARFDVNYYGGP